MAFIRTANAVAPPLPDDESVPAITQDGATIIVPYVFDDGARGSENLTILAFDRAGAIVQRIPVVDVDNGPVAGGEAAKKKLYAAMKPILAMTELHRRDYRNETHGTYDGLTIVFSEWGTLIVSPKGAKPVRRSNRAWRTKPTRAQQAAMDKAHAAGEIECFNRAKIGAVWIDVKRRAAVVYVAYHGNDSCWGSDGEPVVFTW
ncbi:MAG: hypothetical protein ACKV2T_11005 [Kofleriaceae bacterium]